MCARYQLPEDWSDFPDLSSYFKSLPVEPPPDVRPTHVVPIFRRDDAGRLFTEARQWGFLRTWPGKSGKMVTKPLINAVGEELEWKRSFKKAWQATRCLVPMAAWIEWPTYGATKWMVRVGLKERAYFCCAGLYETSPNPKGGDPIETFTIVTVPPLEFLGQVHDRAPLVLLPEHYDDWLDGGPPAQSLIGPYLGGNDAFWVERLEPAKHQPTERNGEMF